MKPGATARPDASITRDARASGKLPTSAIRSPAMTTSALHPAPPDPSITLPFLIRMSALTRKLPSRRDLPSSHLADPTAARAQGRALPASAACLSADSSSEPGFPIRKQPSLESRGAGDSATGSRRRGYNHYEVSEPMPSQGKGL